MVLKDLIAEMERELNLDGVDRWSLEEDVRWEPVERLPEAKRKYTALFCRDPEDAEMWLARIDGMPECHTVGRSFEHARWMIRDALGCFVNGVDAAVIVEKLVPYEEWE